jgi:hypothetical protein
MPDESFGYKKTLFSIPDLSNMADLPIDPDLITLLLPYYYLIMCLKNT